MTILEQALKKLDVVDQDFLDNCTNYKESIEFTKYNSLNQLLNQLIAQRRAELIDKENMKK